MSSDPWTIAGRVWDILKDYPAGAGEREDLGIMVADIEFRELLSRMKKAEAPKDPRP